MTAAQHTERLLRKAYTPLQLLRLSFSPHTLWHELPTHIEWQAWNDFNSIPEHAALPRDGFVYTTHYERWLRDRCQAAISLEAQANAS